MTSDLESLLEMGFEKERAEIAIKRPGGLQGALQWLEDNQDKSLEDIEAAETETVEEEREEDVSAKIAEIETGQARSLVCNECGKRFRSHDMATFHASKTEHTDFSESTEEIAPLTEEEKNARLTELREKLKEKRVAQSIKDREDQKRNEKIRNKATKESQEAKEELQRKEQIKEATRKRREKQEDLEVKKQIKARIEADKAERRRRAEEAKAARDGGIISTLGGDGSAAAATAATAAAAQQQLTTKTKTSHSDARLRLQTDSGNIMRTLPAETTLFEVAQLVQEEKGIAVTSFTTTFPKQTFEGELDMSKTLKEAGLVPSSVLIVK